MEEQTYKYREERKFNSVEKGRERECAWDRLIERVRVRGREKDTEREEKEGERQRDRER